MFIAPNKGLIWASRGGHFLWKMYLEILRSHAQITNVEIHQFNGQMNGQWRSFWAYFIICVIWNMMIGGCLKKIPDKARTSFVLVF